MPVLIGAVAAMLVFVTALGSVSAAISAFMFAWAVSYLWLPVLAPTFVGIWFLASLTCRSLD